MLHHSTIPILQGKKFHGENVEEYSCFSEPCVLLKCDDSSLNKSPPKVLKLERTDKIHAVLPW